MGERAQQAGVVALVQADRRFVQDVHDAHEARADLAGEADALRLAAGEGLGAAVEGQVVEPHVHQEAEPGADLLDDLLGDRSARAFQFEAGEILECVLHGAGRDLRGRPARDVDVPRLLAEARAAAGRTGAHGQVLLQALAHRRGLGLVEAALHVGNDALEGVAPVDRVAPVVDVAEIDALEARAEKNRVLLLLPELPELGVHVELVVAREGLQQVEVVDVAAVPPADGAVGDAGRRVGDDQVRVEVLLDAQPVALLAGADRVVEREQARLEFADAVAALGAGETRREHEVVAVPFDETRRGDPLGELQGRLERLGQALLHVGPDTQAVDHRLDRVLLVLVELRRVVEVGHDAVDARADEAVRRQLVEHVQVLALAVADDGREQHDAAPLRQRQDLVDHLADRLGIQCRAVRGAARLADAREQQPQVVVDLGDRPDGGARIVRCRLLFDGDGRRQTLDVVDVGLLHHGEELASVGGERLHVAPLALRVQGVEGQRGLARSGEPGNDHEAVARNVEVDVLEVVRACAAHGDRRHRRLHSVGPGTGVKHVKIRGPLRRGNRVS